MRWSAVVVVLAVIGAGVLTVTRQPGPRSSSRLPVPGGSPPMEPGAGVRLPGWQPPTSAVAYLSAIRAAELASRLPANLLARLLYQESRFRPDVIDGTVRGGNKRRGDPGWEEAARGIAQIVPRYHPGVNPLDPFASIPYAARYLADLRRRFGSWAQALAAYNWGQGNLARVATSADWLSKAPAETRRYVEEILRDVPAARAVPT